MGTDFPQGVAPEPEAGSAEQPGRPPEKQLPEARGNQGDATKSAGLSRRRFFATSGAAGLAVAAGSSLLAACTSGASPSEASTNAPAAGASAAVASTASGNVADKVRNKKIGIASYSYADENEILCLQQLQDAATMANLNWELTSQDAQASQSEAEQIVAAYVAEKVDAIIDFVVPPRLIPAQLASAKQAGIPVFGLYSYGFLSPDLVMEVEALNAAAGVFLIQYMFLDQQRRHPGKKQINLALFDTPLDVIAQTRGVINGLLNLPSNQMFRAVEVTEIDPANLLQGATSAAQTVLSKYSDLDAIWCNHPVVAAPTATAVQTAGRSGTVKVYGNTTGSAGLQLIRQGNSPLVATSWVDLVHTSWNMVDQMLRYFAGQTPNRFASLTTAVDPVTGIDQQEANSPNVQMVKVLGGKKILTWMQDGGAYRDTFLRNWKQEFGV